MDSKTGIGLGILAAAAIIATVALSSNQADAAGSGGTTVIDGVTVQLNLGDVVLPDGGIEIWDGGTECACHGVDAGACLISGTGALINGNTFAPGTFNGPGCIHKACREPAGAQGQSMPSACQ